MTHHGRHRKRHVVEPFVAAVATAAVLIGVAWAINGYRGDGGPDQTTRTQTASASVQAAILRATADCRTARDRFTEDIVAMHGAIQQWRIHIDAMTQLTSGKIDLDQAIAFWDSTRIEGKRSLALWERLDRRYRSARATCEVPAAAESDAGSLQACKARQKAADVVLADARKTLADWKLHIQHMDALRAGTLDPKHAIHLWHQMYQRGKVALARYDVDHKKLDRVPDCAL